MLDQLPPSAERIRQRLVQRWIAQRRAVDSQSDGLQAIAAAFWGVLATMTGTVATRAMFSRAIALAGRENGRLGSVRVVDGGLDLARFRSDRGQDDPELTSQALTTVVDNLLLILYRLLGNVLVPLLDEVEAELAKTTSAPG